MAFLSRSLLFHNCILLSGGIIDDGIYLWFASRSRKFNWKNARMFMPVVGLQVFIAYFILVDTI